MADDITEWNGPDDNAWRLEESAKLYSEVYAEDEDLRILTQQAIREWPE